MKRLVRFGRRWPPEPQLSKRKKLEEQQEDAAHVQQGPAPERKPVMDVVLPPEMLTAVVDYLTDSSDIESVRRLSRNFRAAAWPAFGRSFNNKIFHPVVRSMVALEQLAKTPAVPYIRHLQLSTVNIPETTLEELENWVHESKTMTERNHRQAVYTSFSPDWYSEIRDKAWSPVKRMTLAMSRALPKFTALEEVMLVHGGKLPYGAQWPGLSEDIQRLCADRGYVDGVFCGHNDWLSALDVLRKALESLPAAPGIRIRKLHVDGMVPLDALPAMVTLEPDTGLSERALLPRVTHLELRLSGVKGVEETSVDRLVSCLPAFLKGMPAVTDVRLFFPPEAVYRDGTAEEKTAHWTAADILYGLSTKTANEPILHLPKLASLHMGNVHVTSLTPLHAFLSAHSKTLRKLTFQNFWLDDRDESYEAVWTFLATWLQLETFKWLLFANEQHQKKLLGDPNVQWTEIDRGDLRRVAKKVDVEAW